MKRRLRILGPAAAALALVAGVAVTGPAQARHVPKTRFTEVDLVSDIAGRAPLQDPKLVNPWGVALGPTTPLWAADNGTDVATVYAGGAGGVTKRSLEVSVEEATGEVFNDTDGFAVNGSRSFFIFDSEGGDISAWNPSAGTSAVQVAHVDGAIYKGLALLHTRKGAFLLAADFHNARIDVFDSAFHRVRLPRQFFNDPSVPKGFAPFNVTTVGDSVFVSYAKQDADREDEVAGPGLGFVTRFQAFGLIHRSFAAGGVLNAPWAMVAAPASFGSFADDILVGNFGDGRINAFDRHGHFRGTLRAAGGGPIVIDGLWGLVQGTATTGGEDSLWFAAGIDDEAHGLLGIIHPAS